MIIKLKGVTRHGKTRIAEHGTQWEILPTQGRNSFGGFSTLLKSVKTGDMRWLTSDFVEIKND